MSELLEVELFVRLPAETADPRVLVHLRKLLDSMEEALLGPLEVSVVFEVDGQQQPPQEKPQPQPKVRVEEDDPEEELLKGGRRGEPLPDGMVLRHLEIKRWIDASHKFSTIADFCRRCNLQLNIRGWRSLSNATFYSYLSGASQPPDDVVKSMAHVMKLDDWRSLLQPEDQEDESELSEVQEHAGAQGG